MSDLSYKKIAIYGGTFNPIHIGHLLTAFEVIEKLKYDHIIFVPANIPAHKKTALNSPSANDRLKMVKLALSGVNIFSCHDLEIKRGGISYTIETVIELAKSLNYKKKFGVILGDDLLPELHLWKDIEKLNNTAELICLTRNKNKTKTYRPKLKIKLLENRLIEISSTEIRSRIKNKLPIDFLVTDKVKEYIIKNKLYTG
jgi:nicotinate-nucleotide adenylyltransferase